MTLRGTILTLGISNIKMYASKDFNILTIERYFIPGYPGMLVLDKDLNRVPHPPNGAPHNRKKRMVCTLFL